jgi:hypothetical protein
MLYINRYTNPLRKSRRKIRRCKYLFNLFFLRVQASTVPAPTGINSTRLHGRFRIFRRDVLQGNWLFQNVGYLLQFNPYLSAH